MSDGYGEFLSYSILESALARSGWPAENQGKPYEDN
jgi:hypothetical protein